MTYEELWAAQVRLKASQFATMYHTLQHLIGSRTKVGEIHGNVYIDHLHLLKDISVDTPVIKVNVRGYRGNREIRPRTLIYFLTKR